MTRQSRPARVALKDVRSLTLHAGKQTAARRAPAASQLNCAGPRDLCKQFSPPVVRCWNNGGEGADIDWTCEADLPETLRFGQVEVSCEGWSGPGDLNVLKGSCGLNYYLVDVSSTHSTSSSGSPVHYLFLALTIGLVAYCLILLLKNCMGRTGTTTSRNRPPGGGGNGNTRGRHDYPPPPPYSERPRDWKNPTPGSGSSSSTRTGSTWYDWTWNRNTSGSGSSGGRFWQGVGLGGLAGAAAAGLWNRRASSAPPTMPSTSRSARPAASPQVFPAQDAFVTEDDEYDWERQRRPADGRLFGLGRNSASSGPGTGYQQGPTHATTQRRTGGSSSSTASSSTLRTSRGYGTTNVR